MSREIKRVATERVRVSEKRNTRNKTLWGFIEKAGIAGYFFPHLSSRQSSRQMGQRSGGIGVVGAF